MVRTLHHPTFNLITYWSLVWWQLSVYDGLLETSLNRPDNTVEFLSYVSKWPWSWTPFPCANPAPIAAKVPKLRHLQSWLTVTSPTMIWINCLLFQLLWHSESSMEQWTVEQFVNRRWETALGNVLVAACLADTGLNTTVRNQLSVLAISAAILNFVDCLVSSE